MLKLVTAFTLLLVVTVQANPLQSRSRHDTALEFDLEEGCVRQGGLCRRIEECETGNLVTAHYALCPKQFHLGVACCYM